MSGLRGVPNVERLAISIGRWRTHRRPSLPWHALDPALRPPGVHGEGESGVEQLLGVGTHMVQVADAQIVVFSAGAAHSADDSVSLRVPIRPAQHHGGGARAERQRGELGVHISCRGVGLRQPLQRCLLGVAGPFGINDEYGWCRKNCFPCQTSCPEC